VSWLRECHFQYGVAARRAREEAPVSTGVRVGVALARSPEARSGAGSWSRRLRLLASSGGVVRAIGSH
jgi:hypothetical protein